jgi:hypothetical protein
VIEATGLKRFPMLEISQGCAVERVSHLVLYGGYARGWTLRGQDNPAFRQVFTSLFIPEATVEQMRWFNDLQRMTASSRNAFRLHEAFGYINV